MKYILISPKGKKYLKEKSKAKFMVEDGEIDLSKLKAGKIKTHKGVEYSVVKPELKDLLKFGKRGPAVVLPKDFGAIVAYTGVDKNTLCLDAGSGSGWLAAQLSTVAKMVISYEKRKDFYEIAKSNFEFLGLKNVEIKNKDVSKGFDEVEAGLITLDLLDPEKVPFSKSLRAGGYCVAYLPHLEQVEQFCSSLKKSLIVEKILDTREREFQLIGGKAQLKKSKIRKTAYLVFVRKLG